jgi:hypothetical protein
MGVALGNSICTSFAFTGDEPASLHCDVESNRKPKAPIMDGLDAHSPAAGLETHLGVPDGASVRVAGP